MPKAQHPKAASFVRQNLFAGVTSFTELETRIAALPDEQLRGAAFEAFAEAYLATQRKHLECGDTSPRSKGYARSVVACRRNGRLLDNARRHLP